MLSVMATALGGIQRNEQGIQVAANNIANVNTDGYRTQRLDGPTGQVAPANPTFPERPDDWPDAHPYNDVDLASELVRMKTYEVGVKANVKVVAVADGIMEDLLDIFA